MKRQTEKMGFQDASSALTRPASAAFISAAAAAAHPRRYDSHPSSFSPNGELEAADRRTRKGREK